MNDHNYILKILTLKTIAVVGISNKKTRPSFYVSQYMERNGYEIIPVNPFYSNIQGKKCYPDLDSIKTPIDIINIFRRSEYVVPIVLSAIKKEAKAIWMQDGVVNKEAAKLANKRGILVIMNDCILRQHHNLKADLI
tara:strand:+ start:460 stop:870 length:411 start_codon:yes stop_codon:yes gene_type:complete